MTAISKCELISRDCSPEMTRSFRGPESASIGKGSQNVAMAGVFDLEAKPGRESEVAAPLSPVLLR